jgi:alpha-L-fucosidase
MRKLVITVFFLAFFTVPAFLQPYTPSFENLKARDQFKFDRFGLFIHWGASSVLGAGEWVMNNRNIRVSDYKKLINFFNPQQFDAKAWVSMAKNAGMKYIVFITRHHDGFSNWDTKYSDWKITNTPYGKDVLKQLAEECDKQGIKLGLYYSTLDWSREDYPHETGRTGQKNGRSEKGNYDSYFQFMKNQLTELLTNYGPIMSIWLDGHWDQTNPEGSADRTSRIDWRYNELYSLIHQLQPTCMIGNNHHLDPIPGEDFQMFEKDLPGQNKTGLSYQAPSEKMPLESCETMNDSWGFNITDHHYKSSKEIIHYLANAASLGANLLLNVGPMPNGQIQQEFTDTLKVVGEWMKIYGTSIYGTSTSSLKGGDWGVITSKRLTNFIHVLNVPAEGSITITDLTDKVFSLEEMGVDNKKQPVKFSRSKEGLRIFLNADAPNNYDRVFKLVVR